MPASTLRIWVFIHTWTSLVCTVFLLLICLTGLPLIFHEEIDPLVDPPPVYVQLPFDTPHLSLDSLVGRAGGMYPGEVIVSLFKDDDEPQVLVWMAPSFAAIEENPRLEHFIRFDARTGEVIDETKPPEQQRTRFLTLMLRLHVDLFADLAGNLFMGAMGLLFVAALVSGVVLYGPFTRKLDFGVVRGTRAPRTRWLDLHNLLGIVTALWMLVVGATGVLNELASPLFDLWQRTDVRAMLSPWQGQTPPAPNELASVQAVYETATRALPNMHVITVIYPGNPFGSPHHYVLWGHGKTPLAERLFSPVLVDARTGELTAVVQMPWYLRALEISRPLHFGDYGGVPLKIIWALLDLVTIAVLASGLYLWLARHRRASSSGRKHLPGPAATALPEAAE
ncbi:PepSY-associated TM helix domain-containing protein [Azorhizobium sp. AG788]|uniref:PepSY-associated TM helix domain-containing protein n=1 Tax=Azorhizobium sp. AG788 TaxID=2183897 RepID=UPI003138F6C6